MSLSRCGCREHVIRNSNFCAVTLSRYFARCFLVVDAVGGYGGCIALVYDFLLLVTHSCAPFRIAEFPAFLIACLIACLAACLLAIGGLPAMRAARYAVTPPQLTCFFVLYRPLRHLSGVREHGHWQISGFAVEMQFMPLLLTFRLSVSLACAHEAVHWEPPTCSKVTPQFYDRETGTVTLVRTDLLFFHPVLLKATMITSTQVWAYNRDGEWFFLRASLEKLLE